MPPVRSSTALRTIDLPRAVSPERDSISSNIVTWKAKCVYLRFFDRLFFGIFVDDVVFRHLEIVRWITREPPLTDLHQVFRLRVGRVQHIPIDAVLAEKQRSPTGVRQPFGYL